MTPEQIALLRDKIEVWRQESKWGNMDLRDYNTRAADALELCLSLALKENSSG